jgi:hypothetical protein
MTIRDEVHPFCALGPLPSEQDESPDADDRLEEAQRRLHAITKPVTDDEAALLMECFGEDNCFGLSWTLLHLIESAPHRVAVAEPPPNGNPWIARLWRNYQNS